MSNTIGLLCVRGVTMDMVAHVNKTPTSCFRLNVFRLKKLNKRNFSDIGLVILKQKSLLTVSHR